MAIVKQIFLTSGSTWIVPNDWNNNNNKIECIGGGGSGGAWYSGGYHEAGTGGGGGAYSATINCQLSPGYTVYYGIGAGGAAVAGISNGNPGGVTYFNSLVNPPNYYNGYPIASCVADGGAGGGQGSSSAPGAAGGQASNGRGTIKYNGGGSGSINFTNGSTNGGTGGGGAGGPNGDGQTSAFIYGAWSTGGQATSGGAGDAGYGGAGGDATGSNSLVALPGATGNEFATGYGSGGGGAGAANSSYPTGGNTPNNSTGGAGGLYGGGGGGSGIYLGQNYSGAGAPGLIVITYTPLVATGFNMPMMGM